MKIFKIFLLVIAGVILLAAVFAGGVGYGIYYAIAPVGGTQVVKIEVPEGATAGEIGRKLEVNGLIRNILVFRAAVRATGCGGDFKPGRYVIDPNCNVMQIIEQLKKGEGALRLVTIPEGLTIRQIGEVFEQNRVMSAADFMRTLQNYDYKIDGRTIKNPEGYLLPDTYDFPESYTNDQVIRVLVRAFNEIALKMYEEKKHELPVELTLHEVITLASMVEREAQVPEERPTIAMVYYNRLKKNMLLQCDATVQFALGKQKEILTYADLKIDSPYNTYLYKGLPPGPIANPGIKSIKAVLAPENNDYLFYVRNDVKNDGSHVFTRTYQEHQDAIRQYQR
jgi:UPF0755 protein